MYYHQLGKTGLYMTKEEAIEQWNLIDDMHDAIILISRSFDTKYNTINKKKCLNTIKNIATVLSKEKCILKIYKSRNKRQKQLIYVFTSFR